MNLLTSFSTGLFLLNMISLPVPSPQIPVPGIQFEIPVSAGNGTQSFSMRNSALMKVLEDIQVSRSILRSA